MAEEDARPGAAGIEYRRPFDAIRRDPAWKRKIGYGMGIMLIPYVGAVWMMGWQMQYQRAVAWGNDEHVPEWSDFKGQALLGLYGFIAVLPYSFLMSLVVVPVSLFGALATTSASMDGDLVGMVVGMVSMYVIMFGALMALTIVLIPVTSAVTARVALYGTLESGFQLGEIWRLMRANSAELMRAWRYAAVNLTLTLVAYVAFFVLIGGVMAAMITAGQEAAIVPAAAIGAIGYTAFMVIALGVGLVLGLANVHYFGRWARIAYGIGES